MRNLSGKKRNLQRVHCGSGRLPLERIVCVNLDRRQDRWQQFCEGWPYENLPERFAAIDGKICKPPIWWREGAGAWGCYRSHLRIIEDCLNRGIESVLLLEDDATFCKDFQARFQKFYSQLPEDWGCIYLGGQHLYRHIEQPQKINAEVYRPYNVNRTHAWALRGSGMLHVYRWLNETKKWCTSNHIDHHLGTLHMSKKVPTYCPENWLVGQRASTSDVNGSNRKGEELFFKGSSSRLPTDVVAVIGMHRSGSSATAGVLHKLGVYLGENLVGYEDRHGGGYENKTLMRICERAMPFPHCEKLRPPKLKSFIAELSTAAKARGAIAGIKYPHLCMFADEIRQACGDRLKVLQLYRPLTHSIDSLIRREPSRDADQLRRLQRRLHVERQAYGEGLAINFYRLLSRPREVIGEIATYLEISPTSQQIDDAVNSLNPEFLSIAP